MKDSVGKPDFRLPWLKFLRLPAFALVVILLSDCRPQNSRPQEITEEVVDPLATDQFFMRNPEIREDLLEQLALQDVEFWINEDESIGFYVRDTRKVDRIANEAILVWIASQ